MGQQSRLHKKLFDIITSNLGGCSSGHICCECPYRVLENCMTHARVEHMIQHGVRITRWIDSYKIAPTEEDADENGNVLAQTYTDMVRTVRYTEVIRLPDYYVYWMPTPKPHANEL